MMRHQLFHVVLLLFICGVAVISAVAGRAYACGDDEVKKNNNPPVVVVRNVPKNRKDSSETYTVVTSENENWEPLRIRVSTKDVNKEKYCEKVNEKRMDFFDGNNVTCSGRSDSMTKEGEKTIINKILPEAIKLHTDRLRVQRMKSPLQVPDLKNLSICSRFTIPSGHHAPGVPDADFVLYVAAGPGKIGNPLTWAVTCAVDDETKRPIVGAMNINPEHADFTRVNVRYVAHVLAHALGFDYEKMKELSMTKESTKEGETKKRTVVTSATVLKNAKDHYGCQNLEEVRLEHTAEGQPTSHWDRGDAKDELMSVHISKGWFESMGYYTALTIAAFEDMKFFKGNFEMAENMSWGHKAGCGFLDAACKNKVKDPNVSTSMANVKTCTSDRLGYGYYTKPKESTSTCPILELGMSSSCFREEESEDLTLGLSGKDSWCLDADSVTTTVYGFPMPIKGVCGAVKCEDDGVVKVQLKINGEWHSCKKENELITPKKSDYPKYLSGTIKCPKYSEVCTMGANGSSRLRLQVRENIPLEIPEITASSTTENPDTNVPSSSASHGDQNPQTSTVNIGQRTPSSSTGTKASGNREEGSTTPTPGETKNNPKTTEREVSTTPTAAVTTNDAKTTESSVDSKIVSTEKHTPFSTTSNAKETLKDINIQNNNTESILSISIAGKDNSQATRVYPALVLIFLVISNLLVSF